MQNNYDFRDLADNYRHFKFIKLLEYITHIEFKKKFMIGF